MEAPDYKPRNEVRFAVVMYGGVSLAIYINGVAQELFRLVRATAPNAKRNDLAVPDDGLTVTEEVYREIGRRRAGKGGWTHGDLGEDPPVPTRFVVDILTGTSAGGINGILLAKALANGLDDVDALKKLWIEEGQIDDLLNEPGAYEGLDRATYTNPPASLLAGDRLLDRARKAIAGMETRSDSAPNYADELDLTVTMTDLQGLWGPIQLADNKVWEPQHRADLKFVYATAYATGGERNDFSAMDDLLAFSARATSSFPFAFAPVTLSSVTEDPTADERAMFAKWDEVKAKYQDFAFADGGYLQNKPVAHATRALKRRRADAPVERKVIYVEPDPGPLPDLPKLAEPDEAPDVIDNAVAALSGLPRKQPIREDIDAIRERNAAIARVEEAKRRILPEILADEEALSLTGIAASPYRYLRRSDVVEAFTEIVLRATDTPAEGTSASALRLAFAAHAEATTRSDDALAGYLERFDLRYRLRRLTYVEEQVEALLEGEEDETLVKELLDLKGVINALFVDLRAAGRGIRSRSPDAPDLASQSRSLIDAVGPWLSKVSDASQELRADMWADEVLRDSVLGIAETIEFAMAEQLENDSVTAFEDRPELQRVFDRAESIDSVIYPMTWPALEEARSVAIHRVSPYDATSLVPMPTVGEDGKQVGRTRLAGVSLGHFGGFLDEVWRRNDMLWGRLDGAERLVTVLVPHPEDRETFRIRAHAAILRDEFRGDGGDDLLTLIDRSKSEEFVQALAGTDEILVNCFADAYIGPAKIDRSRQAALALRSLRVAGKVFGGVERPGFSFVGFVMRAAGAVTSGWLWLRDRLKRLAQKVLPARR